LYLPEIHGPEKGACTIRVWLLALGYWHLVIGICLLAFGYWRLAIGVWLLACGYWNLGIGIWLLEFVYWHLAIGIWLLAFGILAFGYWHLILAFGCWHLAFAFGAWQLASCLRAGRYGFGLRHHFSAVLERNRRWPADSTFPLELQLPSSICLRPRSPDSGLYAQLPLPLGPLATALSPNAAMAPLRGR